MNYLAIHENRTRGTFDFPIEFHHVDHTHPRYQMAFHWHIECELILVVSGTFDLALGEASRMLEPGDAVFIPEGAIHGGTPHDCVYECLVYDSNRFLREDAIGSKTQGRLLEAVVQQPHFFGGTDGAHGLVARLFETMEGELPGYEFSVTGLLWQLMGEMVRASAGRVSAPVKDRHTEQMKRVLRRIRRDYGEALTLDDLATEADMSPKYFCRAFRRITGRTPVDYLNYYRVECAGELLRMTEEPVTEVALSCGFNDLSYFSRAFRKYKGVSAQKYRKM